MNETVNVAVFKDGGGKICASGSSNEIISLHHEVIRREDALIMGRGELTSDHKNRWYDVQLADGSRHMVVGPKGENNE